MGCMWSTPKRNEPDRKPQHDDRDPHQLHFAISNANLGPNYGAFNQNTFFQGHSEDTSPLPSPVLAVEQRRVDVVPLPTGTLCNVPSNHLAATLSYGQDQSNTETDHLEPSPPSPVPIDATDSEGVCLTHGNTEDLKDVPEEGPIRSDIRSHSDTNPSRLENRTSSIGVAEIDPGEIPERQDGGDVRANRDHADPFTTSQDEQTELDDDTMFAENTQISTSNPEPNTERPPSPKTPSSSTQPGPIALPDTQDRSRSTRAEREAAVRELTRVLENSGDGKKFKREAKRIIDDAEKASRKLAGHAFWARSFLSPDQGHGGST